MKREEIKKLIDEKLTQIDLLQQEIIELKKQNLLISDDKQWFTEEIFFEEKKKFQRKENYLNGKLVGRIHWKESFQNEDSKEPFIIDRSLIVRIDNQWVNIYYK